MAIEKVREYFKKFGIEDRIIEFDTSSATVALAAEAAGCEPARIAKSLAFRGAGNCILVVTAGDTKIDNGKFKKAFGLKAKMLSSDETLEMVGHAVGGVCPFGINEGVAVYLDISMKRFHSLFPACGSDNSAAEFTTEELYKYSNALDWVDVCKGWESKELASKDDSAPNPTQINTN